MVRARIAVAVLALAATSALLVPTSASSQGILPTLAQTVAPVSGGKIAFASNRILNSNYEIFTMDPDGGNPTRITTDDADDTEPSWSPDGTRIAFVRDSVIWVMSADGTDQTNLHTADPIEHQHSSSPTWSPDGTQIAYVFNGGIWVMNADGSDQHAFVTTEVNDDPAWSPDGTQIAFSRTTGPGSEIWTKNIADGVEENVTNDLGAADDEEPAWTPDGQSLAFSKHMNLTDIALVKTASANFVKPEGPYQYELTVENRSDVTAAGIIVTDTLPLGVSVDRVDPETNCSVSPSTVESSVVTCDLGMIEGTPTSSSTFNSATVTIEVEAPAEEGTITNTATVTVGNTYESNIVNNTAAVDVTVDEAGPVERLFRAELASRIESSSPGGRPARQPAAGAPAVAAVAPGTGCIPSIAARDICLIGADGFGLTHLTTQPDGTSDGSPAFSPDGSQLAFDQFVIPTPTVTPAVGGPATIAATGDAVSGTAEIMVANGDGTAPVNVTVNLADDVDPSWRGGADVVVMKTDNPDPVGINGDLTYNVTVTNGGSVPATAVTLVDSLPAGVTVQSATSTQGSCSGTFSVSCSLATIDAQTTVTVTIQVTAPPIPGVITNTVHAESDTPDPNVANNVATQDTTVIAADLSVVKSDNRDPVPISGHFTYAIAVSNNSASPATGVVLTDSLPPGVEFHHAAPPGVCSGVSTVTCSIGTIPEGTTTTVLLSVTAPDTAGVIENSVSVGAANPPDPFPSNNLDVEETTVVAADVSIAKTDAPDPVLTGGELMYTMRVTNNGAITATDVLVTDPLPDGINVKTANSTPGTCSGTTIVTCSIGTLDSGESATVTIAAAVRGDKRVVTNTATVSATSPDDVPENNTASERSHVGQPILELLPAVGPPGFVTIAEGSGFPRRAEVTLAWDPGIGELEVIADAGGVFRTQVLIFPGDIQGPRVLVATGDGFTDVEAPFLVEPATIQPRDFASRS